MSSFLLFYGMDVGSRANMTNINMSLTAALIHRTLSEISRSKCLSEL